MDSLTKDVERIFSQYQELDDKDEDVKKSAVCRAIEYMIDVAVLLMVYIALFSVFLMAIVIVLLRKAGTVFFVDKDREGNHN